MRKTRRHVLAAAGLSFGLVSGCLSGDSKPHAPRVVALVPRNFHDEPHRFDLTVRHDGERVHESGHELDAAEGRTWTEDRVEGPWGDAPDALELDVVLDGTDEHTHAYADSNRDCFTVSPSVSTDGSYDPWIGNEGGSGCDW